MEAGTNIKEVSKERFSWHRNQGTSSINNFPKLANFDNPFQQLHLVQQAQFAPFSLVPNQFLSENDPEKSFANSQTLKASKIKRRNQSISSEIPAKINRKTYEETKNGNRLIYLPNTN